MENAVPKDLPIVAEVQTGTSLEAKALSALEPLQTTTLTGSLASRFLSSGILETGQADAPLTLTVVTEYHCTYCYEFHRDYMDRLQEDFIDRGILKVQHLIFPLEKYPNGPDTQKAMYCAGKVGKGEAMHHLLFTRPSKHRSSLLEYAEELGLDKTMFNECMDSEETAGVLQKQADALAQLEIDFVPTFVLLGKQQVGLPIYPDLRGWIRLAEKSLNE